MANEPGKTIEETVKELEMEKAKEAEHLKRRHRSSEVKRAHAVAEHKKPYWERK
jgi:hypothetical protein